jgi:hypothetical protein
MHAILKSRMLVAVVAAFVMSMLMGFRVEAMTDPPMKPKVATTSSLEGSSCQHPYRIVRDLRHWRAQTHLGGADGRTESRDVEVRFHNINLDYVIQFDRSLTGEIIKVEFLASWFTNGGRICKAHITFHGLPTYTNRSPHDGDHYFHFPVRSDKVETLEVTAAR